MISRRRLAVVAAAWVLSCSAVGCASASTSLRPSGTAAATDAAGRFGMRDGTFPVCAWVAAAAAGVPELGSAARSEETTDVYRRGDGAGWSCTVRLANASFVDVLVSRPVDARAGFATVAGRPGTEATTQAPDLGDEARLELGGDGNASTAVVRRGDVLLTVVVVVPGRTPATADTVSRFVGRLLDTLGPVEQPRRPSVVTATSG